MTGKQTQKNLSRVTVICGDDGIGRERAKVQIIKQIQKLHDEILFERFDSTIEPLRSFLEKIISPSLFKETRIFTINHVESLSDSDLTELSKSLSYDVPDAYLILEIQEVRKGKESETKTAKKLKVAAQSKNPEHCSVLEFIRPPDYKLAAWLVTQVPQLFGRTIGQQEADLLVDLTGPDLESLYSELQKIDIHLDASLPIQKSDIQEICGESRQMSVFEISEVIAKKDFPRVLKIIDSLFSTTFYAPVFISTLFRYFWAIFRIRRFADSNPKMMQQFLKGGGGYGNSAQNDAAFAIGRAAGLLGENDQRKVYPVIIKPGIVQQARKYTDRDLKVLFRWLLDFDIGVKTGKVVPDQQSIQLLCYKIIRVNELCNDGAVA